MAFLIQSLFQNRFCHFSSKYITKRKSLRHNVNFFLPSIAKSGCVKSEIFGKISFTQIVPRTRRKQFWQPCRRFFDKKPIIFRSMSENDKILIFLKNFLAKMFLWTGRIHVCQHQYEFFCSTFEKKLKIWKFKKAFWLKMSVWTRKNHFWEHQSNGRNLSLKARKKSINSQFFEKNRSKCSSENRFWEYLFLSKFALTELKASFLAP